MIEVVECRGAPRDLGLDQGEACGARIRAALEQRRIAPVRRWLPDMRRLTSGPVLGAGAGRETLRHYPHLAERLSGIARAAWVPLDSLMELLVAAGYGDPASCLADPGVALAAVRDGAGREHGARSPADASSAAGGRSAAGSEAAPVLLRTLRPDAPWMLRRSHPEVGFRSAELTLPWLATAVAGVNEHGLAIAAVRAGSQWRRTGLPAPPAWLLVQECLQRFDTLEMAARWCETRPSAGALELLLQDAQGGSAQVRIDGAGVAVQRSVASEGGFALCGGPPDALEAVRKRWVEGDAPGTALRAGEAAGTPGRGCVRIEPAEARLCWERPAEAGGAGPVAARVAIHAAD